MDVTKLRDLDMENKGQWFKYIVDSSQTATYSFFLFSKYRN